MCVLYHGCLFRITAGCPPNVETPGWKNSGVWPVSSATAPRPSCKLSTYWIDSSPSWRCVVFDTDPPLFLSPIYQTWFVCPIPSGWCNSHQEEPRTKSIVWHGACLFPLNINAFMSEGVWSHPLVVTLTGATQTRSLHWSLLSAHRRQKGGGGERPLPCAGAHSHQPEQVHRVRHVSNGEDYLGEAQCGAPGGDSLHLPAPLLLSIHLCTCWKVSMCSSDTHFDCVSLPKSKNSTIINTIKSKIQKLSQYGHTQKNPKTNKIRKTCNVVVTYKRLKVHLSHKIII